MAAVIHEPQMIQLDNNSYIQEQLHNFVLICSKLK